MYIQQTDKLKIRFIFTASNKIIETLISCSTASTETRSINYKINKIKENARARAHQFHNSLQKNFKFIGPGSPKAFW